LAGGTPAFPGKASLHRLLVQAAGLPDLQNSYLGIADSAPDSPRSPVITAISSEAIVAVALNHV
jgi:hypothetical protein